MEAVAEVLELLKRRVLRECVLSHRGGREGPNVNPGEIAAWSGCCAKDSHCAITVCVEFLGFLVRVSTLVKAPDPGRAVPNPVDLMAVPAPRQQIG